MASVEIVELKKRCPVVHAALTSHEKGERTYEQALEKCVLELSAKNSHMQMRLTDIACGIAPGSRG